MLADYICRTCGEEFYDVYYPKLGYCPNCRDKDSLEELDDNN